MSVAMNFEAGPLLSWAGHAHAALHAGQVLKCRVFPCNGCMLYA